MQPRAPGGEGGGSTLWHAAHQQASMSISLTYGQMPESSAMSSESG